MYQLCNLNSYFAVALQDALSVISVHTFAATDGIFNGAA